MEKLVIVIPAYNEEENIRQVLDDWYPIAEAYGEDSRMLVIDDGSKDHTCKILCDYAKDHPRLIPETKANGGHGAAVLYGYRRALNLGADYIFQTDSDGQTLPAEFGDFWKQRREYDMVIGRRTERQDGFMRVLVSKVLKLVIRICFGETIADANTPYRLMKAKTVERYIDLIPKDFNLSNVLLSVIFAKKGCRVLSLPITFRPRQGGENSINMKKIIAIGRQALRDFQTVNRSLK